MKLQQLRTILTMALLAISYGAQWCGAAIGVATTALAAATATQETWETTEVSSRRGLKLADYISDPSLWQTPAIRPQGFQFAIQISSLGDSYSPDLVRRSIKGHSLGETESALSPTMAAEWGYSFTHLDGQLDGSGRPIEAGYKTPPANRAECLTAIEAFLRRQYISGAGHPWASMNGHYPWHHYAAELGFDQIGSEIGENINNYQWHIALTRGAARQYGKPWFMDFSAWHGPSITDYSSGRIWGQYSGVDHGHSMSLLERSLFMSYMSGADQITAEAGGALCFLPEYDHDMNYQLSPYGEVCRRFHQFTIENPDVGIAYTPFAVVLDFYHGAYAGFEGRKAFFHFEYTRGDDMTWDLVNMFWPGGWEVMGKNETGTMVNGPYGDTCDILLQNAPLNVLSSYPCVILSGGIAFSATDVEKYREYVRQGGTLILNSAYLNYFREYEQRPSDNISRYADRGKGQAIVYRDDFETDNLDPIIREQLGRLLPVHVSAGIQYIVNIKDGVVYVTLINNDGVTKEPKKKPVVDVSKRKSVVVSYRGQSSVQEVKDIKNNRQCSLDNGREVTVTIPAGELAILQFTVHE